MSNVGKYTTISPAMGLKLLQQQQHLHHSDETDRKISSLNTLFSPPGLRLSNPETNNVAEKSVEKLREQYEALIREGNSNPREIDANLKKLRTLILMEGLPPETEKEGKNVETKSTLRGRIWQILLRVKDVDAAAYVALVKKGPSDIHEKLSNDGFRSFKGRNDEVQLLARVTEPKMFRILNAFRHHAIQEDENLTYVQGLNNVISPFLYVMTEVDAYFTFTQFIKKCCPLYFTIHPPIEGAYAGQELCEKILKTVDPELMKHFELNNFPVKALILRCILGINSTTPPMTELLKLWDFLIAFGVHLNIICVVAQIVLIRDDLLATNRPQTLLHERAWPKLNAELLISVCTQLLVQLPETLYEQLVEHPFKSNQIKRKSGTMPSSFRATAKKALAEAKW